MQQSGVLKNLATEVVCEKVLRDKYQSYFDDQIKQKEQVKEYNQYLKEKREKLYEDTRIASSDQDEFDEEAENIFNKMREQKMEQYYNKIKSQKNQSVGGILQDLQESEFLTNICKGNVVVHFYHQTFLSCEQVNKHLKEISGIFSECKFFKIDAERAPFFVNKLKIQILPCVVMFIDGIVVDKMVGLDEIGGENFKQIDLIRRLVKGNVINPKNKEQDLLEIRIS